MAHDAPLSERLTGVLLGLALGDALGLPFEGLSAKRATRRLPQLEQTTLFAGRRFVSDDTEQAALLCEAILRARSERETIPKRFRYAMIFWLLRLPFGIGLGTLRATLRMVLGFRSPGVSSAGNGAAMRAAPLGVLLPSREERVRLGVALAQLTHTDPRAVEGALFVAELTAAAAASDENTRAHREGMVARASEVVAHPELRAAIAAGERGQHLGSTGFVIHSVALCTQIFVEQEGFTGAVAAAIAAGGDTDTHAAIVGAWFGALNGEASLPTELLASLAPGPFGVAHLRGLAAAACSGGTPPPWSASLALLRNLALYPVIIAWAFRRLTW